MRIAIDLDGVCYEWERTARYMLREYRGCKGLEGQSTHWDWIKERISDADWKWLWTDAIPLGLFRYGHCVRGSVIGLRQLASVGHELIAVTHRPSSAVPDTLAWLAYNNIPWSEVNILSHQEPKSTIPADVLIDDKIENIREWKQNVGPKAIMYTRPWNWQYVGVYRAHSWREVVELVGTL